MDIKTQILKKGSVFNALGNSDLDTLAALMEQRVVQEGEILAVEGERGTYFFVLASGTVLLSLEVGKSLVLDTPGSFIGLELLTFKGLYKSTVTVLEKGMVLAIKREAFIDIIREDSAAGETLMQAWNRHLEEKAPFVKLADNFDYQY